MKLHDDGGGNANCQLSRVIDVISVMVVALQWIAVVVLLGLRLLWLIKRSEGARGNESGHTQRPTKELVQTVHC